MALLVNLQNSDIGAPVTGAYLKVVAYNGNSYEIYCHIVCFYSSDARNINAQPVFTENKAIQLQNLSGDLLPAIYKYLKTLPEYEGAIDC
jgi:hypothetical protein